MSATPTSGTDFFSTQAERWQGLYERKSGFRDRLMLFTDAVQRSIRPPASVLDFGCGTGAMSLTLAQLGYRVHGVDGAAKMIDVARQEKARRQLVTASFDISNATEFSAAPGNYDLVLCSSVIEYVEDDLGLVVKLVDALKPGGTLLISVPHSASLLGRMEDLLRHSVRFMGRRGSKHLNFSLRRYRRRRLLAQFEGLGLTTLCCTYFELPLLGRFGVALSRVSPLGVMVLIAARKNRESVERGLQRTAYSLTQRPARRSTIKALSRLNVWGATPWPIKRAIGAPIALLGPGFLFGGKFRRTLRFVRRTERWPAERAREYQLTRLREACANAYAHSRYYQQSFRRIGFEPGDLKSLEDFARLPLIDKDVVRASLEDMRTVSVRARGVESVATSGTNGQPLHFYIGTDRSIIEYAYLLASWERAGYDSRMPMAVFRGRVVPQSRNGLRHQYDPILRQHYYSSFHMSDDHLCRYLEHLRSVKHCYLHVYPSTGAMLARYIRRTGIDPPANICGIIAESEIVYQEQRRLVEEVFGCRYFACYGHTEKLVAAAECEHTSHYHVWPTYGYFELLDEQGRQITTPGRHGEIVGTGFINHVVPFIRYRTGDYATYVAGRCDACGREHTIITDIRGHNTQETLVAADHSRIPWAALNMHDDTFANVRQFQFYQDSPGRAVLKIVAAEGFSEQDRIRIIRNLDRKLDARIRVNIRLVDSIPLTPIGKSIYVDQRVAESREL